MRFKTYYLQEKLYTKNVKSLKDLISSIAEKDIPTETEVDKGIVFNLTLGGWSGFKNKLTLKLLEQNWKDYSKEPNSLNFKNKNLSLFVEYDGKVVTFFLTDDLNYIPNEEKE
jgi:hypothetical protein